MKVLDHKSGSTLNNFLKNIIMDSDFLNCFSPTQDVTHSIRDYQLFLGFKANISIKFSLVLFSKAIVNINSLIKN